MAELAAGATFAGYRIERRLGMGGMGIVYEAVEPALDRKVALKLIAADAASDPIFLRRFAEESRIAASIEHPNVIPVYAVGEQDGVPWMAMRYVPGSDLNRKIAARNRLEPGRAAAIVAQVAAGLDALHAAGLIHRDVKPANILLAGPDGNEHAYLTDFGLAKHVAAATGITRTGKVMGTLDYIAPEQIRGEAIDARADVYALGCVLYKALTGWIAFPRDDQAQKMYAHLNEPAPKPSVAGCPPGFDTVVTRAMAKDPGERYPSAGDLGRAAIAAAAGGEVAGPERSVATGAAAAVMHPAEDEPAVAPEEPAVAPEGSAEALTAGLPKTEHRGAARPPGARPPLWPPRIPGLSLPRKPGGAAARVGQRPRAARSPRVVHGPTGWRAWLDRVGLVIPAALIAATVALGGGILIVTSRGPDTGGGGGGGGGSPEPLSQEELIAQSDQICLDSRDRFMAISETIPATPEDAVVEFGSEEAAAVALEENGRAMVEVASDSLDALKALRPPLDTSAGYVAFLDSRKSMIDFLEEGTDAAAAGDIFGFYDGLAGVESERLRRYDAARRAELGKCHPTP